MSRSPVFDKFPKLYDTIDWLCEDVDLMAKIQHDPEGFEVRQACWEMELIDNFAEADHDELRGAVRQLSQYVRTDIQNRRRDVQDAIGKDAADIVDAYWPVTEDKDGLIDFAVSGVWLTFDKTQVEILSTFMEDGLSVMNATEIARLI